MDWFIGIIIFIGLLASEEIADFISEHFFNGIERTLNVTLYPILKKKK